MDLPFITLILILLSVVVTLGGCETVYTYDEKTTTTDVDGRQSSVEKTIKESGSRVGTCRQPPFWGWGGAYFQPQYGSQYSWNYGYNYGHSDPSYYRFGQ